MIRFGAKARLFEEYLYSLVHEEVKSDTIRPGLMAKAQAEAMGDEGKAKAIYLKLRVESMRDEASVIAEFERARKRSEEKAPRPDLTSKPTAAAVQPTTSADSIPGWTENGGKSTREEQFTENLTFIFTWIFLPGVVVLALLAMLAR